MAQCEVYAFDCGTTNWRLYRLVCDEQAGQLLFMSQESGNWEVYLMPAAGGAAQNLSNGPGSLDGLGTFSPDGKLVAVTVAQCARLDQWLDGPGKPTGNRSGPASVYVVLRHAEASGTPVPIPGEPCRDESALQADSRVADSFTLDFSWKPPTSLEDDGSRTLAAWLRAIEVHDAPVAAVDIPAFQAAVEEGVKAAIANWPRSPDNPPLAATPGVTPVTDWGSPPTHLVIPRARYAEYINAAFDVWVRKLRAVYAAKHGPAPPAETTAETGLLLAAIDFTLDATGTLVYSEASPPALPATARWLGRPQLLHLRMLQEWLLTNVENDAPREAHYVLGKRDERLPNAQDLASDFEEHDGALARVDLMVDSPPGGDTRAVLLPAVMDVARRTWVSPSKLLMPLAFGVFLMRQFFLGVPDSLLEAARWAPSCYNEQPWLFIYAVSREDRERFAAALVEKNQQQVWDEVQNVTTRNSAESAVLALSTPPAM